MPKPLDAMFSDAAASQPATRVGTSRLARLGGPGFPIIAAIVIAVAARLLVSPVPQVDRPVLTTTSLAAAALPSRAAAPPAPRPQLPAGIALMVDPVTIQPLRPFDPE
ncbi:MAG: hypothetical protein AAF646_13375 [Pseudomonadota bacterium]